MLINKNGTPEILMDVLNTPRTPRIGGSDYSPTSLIMAPRQLQLLKRHGNEVTEDVSDRGAMFIGNALHHEIERQLKKYPEKYLVEQKFYDVIKDRKVAAIVDAVDLDNNTVYDHKKSGTYVYSFPPKIEWEQQLNLYGYFLNKAGIQPERMYINAIFTDWSKGRAQYYNKDYPSSWGHLFDIPVWTEEEQEEYLHERLDLHIANEEVEDNALPLCSKEEMWAKDPTFAVKRKGVHNAKKLCDTQEEAETWINNSRFPELYIEERGGDRTRCAQYCKVNTFCNQYQEYKNA